MNVPSITRWVAALGLGLSLCAGASAQPKDIPWRDAPSVQPHSRVEPSATGGPVGYSPQQLRHAYGVDQLTEIFPNCGGAGQTIALVVAYGSRTAQADLDVFSRQFGLPRANLQIAYPTGAPKGVNPQWALETALDLQWAHAVAPDARLLLVVAKTDGWDDMCNAIYFASTSGAAQVSMSWSSAEFSQEVYLEHYFDRDGVTFIGASGDAGAGARYPAASQHVLAVGGTTLKLDARGNITKAGESAWSGSGGGSSKFIERPDFQSDWQGSRQRSLPDVSYAGDPKTGVAVYNSTPFNGNKGWMRVGGTSAGTPQWAGLVAIVNANRQRPLTDAAAAIYAAGNPGAFAGHFRDITEGGNGGFTAGYGYDYVTGLGTPLAVRLLPALVALP